MSSGQQRAHTVSVTAAELTFCKAETEAMGRLDKKYHVNPVSCYICDGGVA